MLFSVMVVALLWRGDVDNHQTCHDHFRPIRAISDFAERSRHYPVQVAGRIGWGWPAACATASPPPGTPSDLARLLAPEPIVALAS